MRCAQLAAGVVVNVILAEPNGDDVIASATANIGDSYAGGVFTPGQAAPVRQTRGLAFLDFMALFSVAEQLAIAVSPDPQVKLFLLMATGAVAIDLDDPRVQAALGRLVAINLLAPAREAQILAGAPPSP